jgi:hypothetical protein
MADDWATTEKPLTADEVRKAMLHLAAGLHHLQAAVEKDIRRFGFGGPGFARPGEEALDLSRHDLAAALRILVKDPEDGPG